MEIWSLQEKLTSGISLIFFIISYQYQNLMSEWSTSDTEIAIFPMSEDYTTAKINSQSGKHFCQDQEDQDLKQCIEKISFSFQDIFQWLVGDYESNVFLSYDISLLHTLRHYWKIFSFTFKIFPQTSKQLDNIPLGHVAHCGPAAQQDLLDWVLRSQV